MLCAVRLVVLAFVIVDAVTHSPAIIVGLMALLAVPFSLAPALTWSTRGVLYSRSGILLAADMVVSVLVLVVLLGSTLSIAYGAATIALWAVITSVRIALLLAVPICVLLVPWTSEVAAEWGQALAGLIAVVVIACIGGAMGASLRAQDAALAELAEERAARAGAAERMRLARDLHDSVTGDLAGLLLLTTKLSERLERSGAAAQDRELAQLVAEALGETHRRTRTTLVDLRESAADPEAAARGIVERWSLRTGIAADVTISKDLGRLRLERWTEAQSILLELLENVRKHAQATRVSVGLTGCSTGSAEITVTDNGRGIPGELAEGDGPITAEAEDDCHFGLDGIRHRAAECHGTAEWGHAPGGGTVARVRLGPIAETETRGKEGVGSAHPDSR